MKGIVMKTNCAGPKSTETKKKKNFEIGPRGCLIMSALIDNARWRGVLSLIDREFANQEVYSGILLLLALQSIKSEHRYEIICQKE
jgi:hypothetical protein